MTEKAELYFEDGTVVLCTRLTAAYFGVTAATLSNWTRSGCPQLRRGYYDLMAGQTGGASGDAVRPGADERRGTAAAL